MKSGLGLHRPRLQRFVPLFVFRHEPLLHCSHSPHGVLHLPDPTASTSDEERPARASTTAPRTPVPTRAMPRRDAAETRWRAKLSN